MNTHSQGRLHSLHNLCKWKEQAPYFQITILDDNRTLTKVRFSLTNERCSRVLQYELPRMMTDLKVTSRRGDNWADPRK